ncbi:MAG TPA: ATP-dependent Clp protease proteolytic subunit [Candidatus Sulfotelmatobacter sp.]|nr:ATP-dependent Clp protease proteolytic subunit [Candidatus Sulfotelmatobacter sp.]
MNAVLDSDYRPSADRCLYLNAEINQDKLDKLTPEIIRLSAASQSPITLYIDSAGGNTYAADVLYRLLKARNQDGKSSKLITVCTGVAASAAADLLSSGDYSLAYPHARVLYHGTRQIYDRAITTETAANMAEYLKQTNEGFALTLANRSIDRFVFRFLRLRDEFPEVRAAFPDWNDFQCLTFVLTTKLSSAVSELPNRALTKHERNKELTEFVFSQPIFASSAPSNETSAAPSVADNEELGLTQPAATVPQQVPEKEERIAEIEAKILTAILSFELQKNTDENWSFADAGIFQIQEDFVLLRDYNSPRHTDQLRWLAARWGPFFLDETGREELNKQKLEDQPNWLLDKTRSQLHPLWYYFVSICRALQEGENYLSAQDAYWLGLIDEIIGAPERQFPSYRALIERATTPTPQGKTPEPSPKTSTEATRG